jgi:peptide deformylase
MAILPIRIYPDPVLRERAAEVGVVDDAVRKLVADLTETMRAAPGIGLAAPQVGVQRRVFVYSLGEDEPVVTLVNPEIVERSGELTAEEGCLSIPGLTYPVSRAQRVRVRGLDEQGTVVDREAEEMEARVIQHEVDHLDGILFIERIDPAQRREALRVLREQALAGTPTPAPRTPAASL